MEIRNSKGEKIDTNQLRDIEAFFIEKVEEMSEIFEELSKKIL